MGRLCSTRGATSSHLGHTRFVSPPESKADHEADFHTLLKFVVEPLKMATPTMAVPAELPLGHEIYVHWGAGEGRVAHPQDWIGLFKKGECTQLNLRADEPFPATIDSAAPLNQNRCYLASSALTPGVASGTIRFSTAEYKQITGEFETRYFL